MKHIKTTTSIVAILLLILLLALLSRCDNQKINPSTAQIPDSWEVVSTQEKCTHIRMKDGKNDRVWIRHEHIEDFWVDIQLTDNKTYQVIPYTPDGYIPVVVYFGYGELLRNTYTHDYSVIPDAYDEYGPYQLKMMPYYPSIDGRPSTLLLDLPTLEDVGRIKYNRQDKAGYTNAILVNIPLTILNGTNQMSVSFRLYDSRNTGRGADGLHISYNPDDHTVLVETDFNAKEESFPWVLRTPAGILAYGNYALYISAALLGVITAICRKKYALPYLIISAALVFNLIFTVYFDIQNTDNWDFSFLIFFIALGCYLFLAFVLAVIQINFALIIQWIAKRKAKKASMAEPPTPMTENDSASKN